MELSTVNLDGISLDTYYELNDGHIVIRSIEFPNCTDNLLGSLNGKTINKILDILSEDDPVPVASYGGIIGNHFDNDLYESGHDYKDFA
jgi:hypothetical protein